MHRSAVKSITTSIHQTALRERRQFLAGAVLGGLGLAQGLAPLLAADQKSVKIQVNKDHVDFLSGDELIGRYVTGGDIAKPYFWPLNGPGGVAVTRAWPMVKGLEGESTDHVHQKSAWFCHGDVIPEGMELKVKSKNKAVKGVDFWSEEVGHGRIVCISVGEPKKVELGSAVTTRNEWRTADDVKLLDETRTIHFHDLGSAKLLVLDIDLLASVCPLTFGDTKEGSMGIRINDSIREQKSAMEKRDGKLENAEGKVTEKECWGQLSAWCDYSGPINGKVMGLAILDDPKNTPKACWHARGYGLMAANPFGRKVAGFPAMKDKDELFKLAKGEHLKLRYGLLIHSGDAKDGKVATHYKAFVELRG